MSPIKALATEYSFSNGIAARPRTRIGLFEITTMQQGELTSYPDRAGNALMSIEVCENGAGDPKGLGKCRRFLPGMNFVGNDLNDKASSFLVDNKMIGYLNSADFEAGYVIGIKLVGTSDKTKITPDIRYDED